MDWTKTTERRDEKYLNFGIGAIYIRGLVVFRHPSVSAMWDSGSIHICLSKFDPDKMATISQMLLRMASMKIFLLRFQFHWNAFPIVYLTLWPSDTIWRQRSGSILAQVMACCLTAPSHYLNQCWLIISEVQWHSYKDNFTYASTINHWNLFQNCKSRISFKFPRGQWVNDMPVSAQIMAWHQTCLSAPMIQLNTLLKND